MKILLVSGPDISLKEPFSSGIESFMVALANQLVNEGHSVDVVAREASDNSRYQTINPFRLSQRIKEGWLKRKIEQYEFSKLLIEQYDVVHYNMFYPHLIKKGINYTVPSIITLHSPADKKRVSTYREVAKNKNVTFVAISDRIKEQWDNELAIDSPVIYNGIDLTIWPLKHNSSNEYLLWSGRINKDKNTEAAIQLAQHMNLPLKIAGRITDEAYFDTHVRPHLNSRIQYVGHVTQNELSNLAANASTYLATATWQEPFGLAALEMLASGVRTVGFSTAIPTNWLHPSVSIVQSSNWKDLLPLLTCDQVPEPEECRQFASTMSAETMTSNYITLYVQKTLTTSLSDKFNTESAQYDTAANAQLLLEAQTTK